MIVGDGLVYYLFFISICLVSSREHSPASLQSKFHYGHIIIASQLRCSSYKVKFRLSTKQVTSLSINQADILRYCDPFVFFHNTLIA